MRFLVDNALSPALATLLAEQVTMHFTSAPSACGTPKTM
jgi:predicted nuclease of predicted toxin-antitoxin system